MTLGHNPHGNWSPIMHGLGQALTQSLPTLNCHPLLELPPPRWVSTPHLKGSPPLGVPSLLSEPPHPSLNPHTLSAPTSPP